MFYYLIQQQNKTSALWLRCISLWQTSVTQWRISSLSVLWKRLSPCMKLVVSLTCYVCLYVHAILHFFFWQSESLCVWRIICPTYIRNYCIPIRPSRYTHNYAYNYDSGSIVFHSHFYLFSLILSDCECDSKVVMNLLRSPSFCIQSFLSFSAVIIRTLSNLINWMPEEWSRAAHSATLL
jgi:hypothetical protein